MVDPHMAESREGSYRMWGEHVGAVVDKGDGGAACRIARAGGLFRSGGSRPGACRLAVAGRMDERAHCGGVLRAGRQRAALALDFRSRGSGGAARPQGAWSRAEEGASRLEGNPFRSWKNIRHAYAVEFLPCLLRSALFC